MTRRIPTPAAGAAVVLWAQRSPAAGVVPISTQTVTANATAKAGYNQPIDTHNATGSSALEGMLDHHLLSAAASEEAAGWPCITTYTARASATVTMTSTIATEGLSASALLSYSASHFLGHPPARPQPHLPSGLQVSPPTEAPLTPHHLHNAPPPAPPPAGPFSRYITPLFPLAPSGEAHPPPPSAQPPPPPRRLAR